MSILYKLINKIYELEAQLISQEFQAESKAQYFFKLNAELNEYKRQYQELYDFSSCAYITLDQNHQIKRLNFQAANLLCTERKVMMDKSFLNFISSNFKDIYKETIQEVFDNKIKKTCEIEILTRKQLKKFVQVEINAFNNELIYLDLKDITQLQQLEVQMVEMKQRLNLINNLFQSTKDAIAALDSDFTFKLFNPSFAELFTRIFATKINVGMNLEKVLMDFPDLKVKAMNACYDAFLGKKASFMVKNPTEKHKNYYCYELYFHSIENPEHQRKELIFHIRDLSEYKIEQNIRQKQQTKLANIGTENAMGELASALAHEINQPLTAIIAYSRTCMFKIKNFSAAIKDIETLVAPLEQIAQQAELAGSIVHQMKNLMREGRFHLEPTDINLLIKETLSFLEYELIDYGLDIDLSLAKNLPNIMVDRIQIMQIILNLARNSIESLQLSAVRNPKLSIKTEKKKEVIIIHFRDNGPGIPKELRDIILTSYYTTKLQGTGLGLAICQTLLGVHNGKLNIMEQENEGAWLIVSLPITRSK